METIKEESIKLLTWNCLSSKFGSPDAFPKVNKELLEWDNRAIKIKNILKYNNPDILCLVEIDNPEYYKSDILNYDEYEVIFSDRKDHIMGELLAFKKNKFELKNTEELFMLSNVKGEENHNTLYVELNDKKTNKKLNILLTHLKSKYHNEKIREKQIEKIHQFINQKGLKNEALIFTGDFNSEPTSNNYKQIQQLKLQSAFELFDNTKNNYIEYSSCKIRDKLYKYTIDYIYYNSSKIKCLNCGLPEERKSVDFSIGLPNDKIPSDHFYLTFDFVLL